MKLILTVYLLGLLVLASAVPYVEVEEEWEKEAYIASDVQDAEETMMQEEEPGLEKEAYITSDIDVQDAEETMMQEEEPGLAVSQDDATAAHAIAAQLTPYSGIYHGDTVALQAVYSKRNWMGCAGTHCGKAGCPGLYFEGPDWSNCWGEVFQIYRKAGIGPVQAGDVVGLHYPREVGNWFGCAGLPCRARGIQCPGVPTEAFGFHTLALWHSCYGEVFKIYARGKSLGTPIDVNDQIFMQYVRGNNWVSLVGTHVQLATCPGTLLPPADQKYDSCWGEVFEIVKGIY